MYIRYHSIKYDIRYHSIKYDLKFNISYVIFLYVAHIWVWRSLVARLNGVQEVAGSIPVTQTINKTKKPSICNTLLGFFIYFFLYPIPIYLISLYWASFLSKILHPSIMTGSFVNFLNSS